MDASSAAPDGAVVYYRIYRAAAAPESREEIGTTVAAHFTDRAAPGGPGVYTVVAVNGSGNASRPATASWR